MLRVVMKRVGQQRSFSTRVYVWGSGNEGQLGRPQIEKRGLRQSYEELTPLVLDALDDLPIASLAFGPSHSTAVTEGGEMYAWGHPQYGRLGLQGTVENSEDLQLTPRSIEALSGSHIVQSACGDFHTLALDKEGNVYSWGWGGSFLSGVGGLGHGDDSTQISPKLIDTFGREHVRIAQVDCGELHSLALTDDGELWAWGNGEYGRLGNGTSDCSYVPEPMEFFADMNIVSIAAGQSFSLALTEDGKIYGWGKNDCTFVLLEYLCVGITFHLQTVNWDSGVA